MAPRVRASLRAVGASLTRSINGRKPAMSFAVIVVAIFRGMAAAC
jgi:hypothetical protein